MSSYKHSNDAYVDDGSDDVDLDLYEGQDDDEYIEGTAAPKHTRKSTKGRLLKRWDADEDQLLLLYCDYVCAQEGTPMPWDKIAAAMEPRDAANGKLPMTGEAVKQHLAKIRYHREEQGRRVPPKLNRSARRVAAATKSANAAPQTPAPTPTKTAPAAAAAPSGVTAARGKAQAPPFNHSAAPAGGNNPRRKAQTSTVVNPVKTSTLLADVSKSKQRKEKQALKDRQTKTMAEYTPARAGGGGVSTGGEKRGRKKAADPEPDPEPVGNWSLRATVPHNYDETSMGGFEDIGIKDEEVSDNEPLASKKAKTRHGQAAPKIANKGTTKTGVLQDTLNMWANQGTNTGSYESQAQPENVSVFGQASKEPIGAPAYNQAPNNVQSQSQAFNFGARMQHPASSLSLETFQMPAPASFSSDYGQQFSSSPVHDSSSPSFPDSGFSQGSGALYPQIGSASTSMSSSYFPGTDDPFFVSSSQTPGGIGGLPITPLNSNGVPPNQYANSTTYYPNHMSQYNGGNQVPPTPTTPTNYNAVGEWGDMMPQMQDAAQEAQNTFAKKTYPGPSTTQTSSLTTETDMQATTNELFATNDFFNDYVFVDEGDNDFS